MDQAGGQYCRPHEKKSPPHPAVAEAPDRTRVELEHHDAQRHADMRRGDADAGRGTHGLEQILRQLAQRQGLFKRVHPHLLRYDKDTRAAKEAEAKEAEAADEAEAAAAEAAATEE